MKLSPSFFLFLGSLSLSVLSIIGLFVAPTQDSSNALADLAISSLFTSFVLGLYILTSKLLTFIKKKS